MTGSLGIRLENDKKPELSSVVSQPLRSREVGVELCQIRSLDKALVVFYLSAPEKLESTNWCEISQTIASRGLAGWVDSFL